MPDAMDVALGRWDLIEVFVKKSEIIYHFLTRFSDVLL